MAVRTASRVLALTVLVVLLGACGRDTLDATTRPDGSRLVELRAGEVVRYAVPLGSRVELVVASDLADEVHLHGYDRSSFVTAGATTTLRFTADQPGVFEVELENAGVPLGEIAVS